MQCVDTLLDEEQKLFMAVPRVAPMGPCGPFVKSNCFIFFLKMHGWILTKNGRNHPQGQGIQSCSNSMCGPHGGPGEGPKGPKPCKSQTSSSPDPEGEQSSYVVCRGTLLDEEQKLFMAVPRVAPMGPCGPFVKSNCFIFFLKMHGWILTKHGRNHPQGPGIQSCSYGTCGSYGGPKGRAPRAKTLQISNFFLQIQFKQNLQSSCVKCSQVKNKGCWWHFPGWPQWPPCG